MAIRLTGALTPEERSARLSRLKRRRIEYVFDTTSPLAPVPLMHPLTAREDWETARGERVLFGLLSVNRSWVDLWEVSEEVFLRWLPAFVENPLRRLMGKRAPRPVERAAGQLCKLLKERFEHDDEHDSLLWEIIKESLLERLDDDDDKSPFPYNDIVSALLDLPVLDLLDDLHWSPSFPGATPSTSYFVTRTQDLQIVKTMARKRRDALDRGGPFSHIGDAGRFPTVDELATFFPPQEDRGTTAYGLPNPEPLSLQQRVLDSDEDFAWQRLGGVNPTVLRRLNPDGTVGGTATRPLACWSVFRRALEEDGLFAQVMAHLLGTEHPLLMQADPLEHALRSGRLLVADYAPVADARPFTQHGEEPRTYRPTTGLFYADDGVLRPAAILLGAGTGARVYTPLEAGDDGRWRSAKVLFQVADLVHHEMVTHLLESHFTLEGIAVATRRQLDVEHPVAALLHAHLRGVVFNLMLGRKILLAENRGMVDELFPLEKKAWIQVVRAGYRDWTADDLFIDTCFERWGTADTEHLPVYPYRDDSRLLWDTILGFVTDYLGLFYRSDAELAADGELCAWREELRVRYSIEGKDEQPGTGARRAAGLWFTGRASLARLLTGIIFTSGPRHAAVNFAQWDYMMFPANTPASAYFDGKGELPRAEDMMPNARKIADQMEVIQLLAGRQFGRLGYYPEDEFAAEGELVPRLYAVIERFQARLFDIGEIIERRNGSDSTLDPRWRHIPYPYLHPTRVPNSATV